MYEYSDSLKCTLCGQRFIVTNAELEDHVCNCPGIADSRCRYSKPENNRTPIREYGCNRGRGMVLVALEETSPATMGCVFIVDGRTTFEELVASRSMEQFLLACNNSKNSGVDAIRIVTVAIDCPTDMEETLYSSTMEEIFQNTAMMRGKIVTEGRAFLLAFKRVMAFERSSDEPFVPMTMGMGLVPFRDFYCLGYEMDRFCTDPISLKNASMIAYVNELIRHAEPSMYMSMSAYGQDDEYDYSMVGNYIPDYLTREFYDMMSRNKDCRNKPIEGIFSKWSNDKLKNMVEQFCTPKGMTKKDKVDYLSSGQHVETVLREKINGYQYHCLRELMEKGGYDYCTEECDSSYLDLFALGVIFAGTDEDGKRIVYIPREYVFIFKRILYDDELSDQIARMNVIDSRLNGLIYNYGVLSLFALHDMYCKVFGQEFNPFDKDEDESLFLQYVVRKYATWANRDSVGDIYMSDSGIYVFHERMEYPGEIRNYRKPNPMRPPIQAEIEAAGDREYMEYNEALDRISIELLSRIDNKDEVTMQMLNYYIYSALLFGNKQGFPPEEIFENLVRLLPVPACELMHIYKAICQENPAIARWDIGGYSSNELSQLKKNRKKIHTITMR